MSPAEIEAIIYAGVPLSAEWGVRVLDASPGFARLELPPSRRVLRPGNTISGPAIMGLADVAMWAALLAATGGRDESLTTAMNVNFLRACGPGPIIATARVLKGSGRTVFGEVLVTRVGSEDVAAHITTSWVRSKPKT
ncbi:PaaI family thioesterase [Roseococcus sp. YIM B11640]|uniref:PaaI family thioesterase n=1 Tax=Roseococcus sp. YIM B11640 TaxID=3133973 RepID=UPI003C7B3179